jgi:hypothetical protein
MSLLNSNLAVNSFPKKEKSVFDKLRTPQETADKLRVTIGTLTIWRCVQRYNLPYVKVGRKVFYKDSDIENFIKSRTVSPMGVQNV